MHYPTEEELGQELDRWQLIARDLLGYIHQRTIGADPFLTMVQNELLAIPEMKMDKPEPIVTKPLSFGEVVHLFQKVDPYCDVEIADTGDDESWFVIYTSIPVREGN